MRKHRLAERLLADIIGLDWEDVHIEACRWEHVMSEAVERRIVALLDKPLVCPHGNPIPGLDELGLPFATTDHPEGLLTLTAAAAADDVEVTVDRISEQIQPDAAIMHRLKLASLRPGHRVHVRATAGGVEVWADGERTRPFEPECQRSHLRPCHMRLRRRSPAYPARRSESAAGAQRESGDGGPVGFAGTASHRSLAITPRQALPRITTGRRTTSG